MLIHGIIDGYYFTEDGIVLMDYKTDRIQPGKEQDLADRYRTQMAVYRQALQDNTGRPGNKNRIVFFFPGKRSRVGILEDVKEHVSGICPYV